MKLDLPVFALLFGIFTAQAVGIAAPPVANTNEVVPSSSRMSEPKLLKQTTKERTAGLHTVEKRSFTRAERIRETTALRHRTSKLLREEATASGAAQRKATRELVRLFVVVRHHEALTDNQRDKLRWKLRSRLKRIAKRYQKEIERNDRHGTQSTNRYTKNRSFDKKNSSSGNLRQSVPTHPIVDFVEQVIVIQPATMGNLPSAILAQVGAGGPGFLGGPNGAQAALGNADNGAALVELIQTVISPESWDINGGRGSIYYYRPLRVLVIGAPG